MKFRLARAEDLAEIMSIIFQAKESLKSFGIDQWQKGRPNEESILYDISREESFLIEEKGVIIATAALVKGIDVAYENIYEGCWGNNGLYCSIHRIAVLNRYKQEGVASKLLNFLEEKALQFEMPDVRIDTHPGNEIMKKWIVKNGFVYCGKVDLTDGVRLAYQKLLGK